MINLSAGPAGSPGVRGVLPEAGGGAEGGARRARQPGQGEGAGEAGAAGAAQRARDSTGQIEEDRAAAPRSPAGG